MKVTTKKYNSLLFVFYFFIAFNLYSQIGINTDNPHPSAMLDIDHTTSGVLVPRVSLVSTSNQSPIPSGITPVNALLVYNEAAVNDVVKGFYYWKDTKWVKLFASNDSKTYTTPWHRFNTSTPSSSNTNNIEANGTVTIGSPYKQGIFSIITESNETGKSFFRQITPSYNSGYDFDFSRTFNTSYPTTMSSGDMLGVLDWKGVIAVDGNDAVQTTASFAQIKGVVDGNASFSIFGGGDYPSRLEFYTTPLNSITPQLAMEILNDGVLQFDRHNNWDNANANDPVIGIRNNGELVKVDRSAVRNNAAFGYTIVENSTNKVIVSNSTDNTRQEFVKLNQIDDIATSNKVINKNTAIIIGEPIENITTLKPKVTIIKNTSDLSPLLLAKILQFESNLDALKHGLEIGMVYKNGEGDLCIVY